MTKKRAFGILNVDLKCTGKESYEQLYLLDRPVSSIFHTKVYDTWYAHVQVSPSGCAWLEIPVVSQVQKGTGVRIFYGRCEVHLCRAAASCGAAVVLPGCLLLLCRCCTAFEIKRKCGSEYVPRWHVFRIARPHNTHTPTASKAYGVIQEAYVANMKKSNKVKLNGTSLSWD